MRKQIRDEAAYFSIDLQERALMQVYHVNMDDRKSSFIILTNDKNNQLHVVILSNY